MTALANSLRRIWSAKNRGPRLTGRGYSGLQAAKPRQENGVAGWTCDKFSELAEVAQRGLPMLLAVVLQILR
jgi:hypothetical protein